MSLHNFVMNIFDWIKVVREQYNMASAGKYLALIIRESYVDGLTVPPIDHFRAPVNLVMKARLVQIFSYEN